MSTISPIARRVAVVALAAAAAVTLTACDSDQIGAAAVVNGERITVADLQEQAQEIVDVPGSGFEDTPDRTQLQRELLSHNILNHVMRQVAADEGIEVTDAQVDEFVEQQTAQIPPEELEAAMAQSLYTPESFRDASRSQLVANSLLGADGDQTALVAAMDAAVAEIGVEVNPRYGEWDETFAVADVSGSISEQAGGSAEATPAPLPEIEDDH